MNTINEAKRIFDIEIEALTKMRDHLDETFNQILDLITSCKGRVVITGIGKPGHIARKIAATLASLGTHTFYLHPAEALHGDLGMIAKEDVIIAISYSGESDEIIQLLPNIKMIGAKIIAITGNINSTLAYHCDIVQLIPEITEACYLNLAPTSSTTVELVYGDALAVVASEIYGYTKSNFGMYHPAGALGKKLVMTVGNIMVAANKNAVVEEHTKLKDAIVEMSSKSTNMVAVIDSAGKLSGVITDGDLRRLLEKEVNLYNLNVDQVMTKNPIAVEPEQLAVVALLNMKKNKIGCLPVTDIAGNVIGAITMPMILDAGILLS